MNILVVLSNRRTADPLADVVVTGGTSLSPSKSAVKVTIICDGAGSLSSSLHEINTDNMVKITKNLIERFITKYFKG
ncbi:hypothetical protein D3C80_1453590 [compost metagenome]